MGVKKFMYKAGAAIKSTGKSAGRGVVKFGSSLAKEAKPHIKRASREVKREVKKELRKAGGEVRDEAKRAVTSRAKHHIGEGKSALKERLSKIGHHAGEIQKHANSD